MNKYTFFFFIVFFASFLVADPLNRLAIAPFSMKDAREGDSKIAEMIQLSCQKYIEQSGMFQQIDEKTYQKMFNKSEISEKLQQKETRNEILQQLCSEIDYIFIAEMKSFSDSNQLQLKASLYHTAELRLLKSAAKLGDRQNFNALAFEICQGVMPTNKEILMEIQQSYRKAKDAKDYGKAADYCSWALQIQPKSSIFHYQRAECYEAQGEFLMARNDYLDTEKFYNGPFPQVKSDIQRIQPLIESMKELRKGLLERTEKHIQEMEGNNVFLHIELFVSLLESFSREGSKSRKTSQMLEKASSLRIKSKALREEFEKSRPIESSKKENDRLIALGKKLQEIPKETSEIAEFLAKNFKEDSKEYFEKALKIYREDRLEEALVELEKAILLDPQNAKAQYWKGMAFAKKQSAAKAIESLGKAIEIHPSYIEAYYNRALIYKALKNGAKAIEDFESALKLNSRLAEAHFQIAEIYQVAEENEKAIEAYGKGLVLQDNAAAYWQRGKLYERELEDLQAQEDYKKAILLSPQLKPQIEPLLRYVSSSVEKDALVYRDRGKLYAASGETAKAIEMYTKSLEYNRNNPELYFLRGNIYQMQGHYIKAIADYTEAVSLKPTDSLYRMHRAISYQHIRQYENALLDLAQAIKHRPSLADFYHRRAQIYELQKEYDKAVEEYEAAILRSENASYYLDLAMLYAKMKKKEKSEIMRQKARKFISPR